MHLGSSPPPPFSSNFHQFRSHFLYPEFFPFLSGKPVGCHQNYGWRQLKFLWHSLRRRPKTDRVFSFPVPAINLSSISHPAMRKRRRKETRSLKDTLCNADFVSFSRLQQNEEDKGKVGKNGAKSKNVFSNRQFRLAPFFREKSAAVSSDLPKNIGERKTKKSCENCRHLYFKRWLKWRLLI